MPILFAIIFLAVVFKGVGLLLGMCGRLLGAVLSLAGVILSLAVGTLVFGLSAVFSVVLLGIAGVWLVAKLLL